MIKITIEDDGNYLNPGLETVENKPEDYFTDIEVILPTNWETIPVTNFYKQERFPRKQRLFLVVTGLACAVHIRQKDGTFKAIYTKLNPLEEIN